MKAKERQSRILDVNCKKVKTDKFTKELHHPNEEEQQALSAMLKKFPTSFGGALGTPKVHPIHFLELKEGVMSQQAQPFPVSQLLHCTTK